MFIVFIGLIELIRKNIDTNISITNLDLRRTEFGSSLIDFYSILLFNLDNLST